MINIENKIKIRLVRKPKVATSLLYFLLNLKEMIMLISSSLFQPGRLAMIVVLSSVPIRSYSQKELQPIDGFQSVVKQLTDSITLLKARVSAIEDKSGRVFHFGISLGFRSITNGGEHLEEPTFSADSFKFDTYLRDRGSMVISGVLLITPWPDTNALFWYHVGFLANVNLIDLTSGNIGSFNRNIEGGGGIAYRLTDNFSLALTYERVFHRSLTEYYLGRKGVNSHNQLTDDRGQVITQLDPQNDHYFRDDDLDAISIKFVFLF